eukprot:310062-Pelagomonas_calceolata.AAC.1
MGMTSLSNNKSSGPNSRVNESPRLLHTRSKKASTNSSSSRKPPYPSFMENSDTILIDNNKGDRGISSCRPIGLANTLCKLWICMVTNTLHKFAEAHSLLSSAQAGFRNQKVTTHQLQNVIIGLKDAKTFGKKYLRPYRRFASAFNTPDHDRVLWITFDLGFPTDAIDT